MTFKCFCHIWHLFYDYIIQVNCRQCFSGDFTPGFLKNIQIVSFLIQMWYLKFFTFIYS